MLAVGTRLQDFTTSSWTAFAAGVRVVTLNAARFDAVKHARARRSSATRGRPWPSSTRRSAAGAPTSGWTRAGGRASGPSWDAHVDRLRGGVAPDGSLTYAQVVGVVNDASGRTTTCSTSSGGFPGELHGGWRPASRRGRAATMDLEYGFSCMGYEVAGPVGRGDGPGADPPGRAGHRRCSATART